ncbi:MULTISPECIES: ABC transporter ATP-binding protein [Brevibacillus]|uniref:ABC transporter ATP-binding protein n=1 Tax=Brevibacillus TaxID=55080 RepID=UPI000D111E8E|nr:MULTISPECIES: dipeptide ABC transporter ATP-binding protein [Brevibacillus]MED1943970.1 dipeptide ABC transporter ATP-binding protein [Brevibacillus formosus]MED1999658.1 dipeptide ABC transporter ATP-binding protein [Brevibacillus formosus]MED2082205.1 dipeptide ABC transporter ATP-binding protein [Brevibacillus formosus]PSK18870.1 dipeptide/oligopeptide/nickel ABC transporter ATP-binding protein [Brevibacillus sp. NRRL NRS-603]
MTTPILEVKGLRKLFRMKKGWFQQPHYVHALNGIDMRVYEGETLGIVGESGCGKSTLGKCILRLLEPVQGEIRFQGNEIGKMNKNEMRAVRRNMQMVFQNPFETLNPKLTIGHILTEPLISHGIPRDQRQALLEETIEIVGMSKQHLSRYPHEFSGGQRQRIGIARALILRPKLIIADEPVSALDVSIQSQILNLLQDLQEQFSLTYVFISHDLSVVEYIADKVAVMYLGEIIEYAEKEKLFGRPLHPYTQALLSAKPITDPDDTREQIVLSGDLPSPSNPPVGCKFHPRCRSSMEICKVELPKLCEIEGQSVACHLYQSYPAIDPS